MLGLLLAASLPGCQSASIASCPTSDLVTIPAGWFMMGKDDGRRSNEPEHRVYLDGYSIQRTEVTNCQYLFYIEDVLCQ
jgi:formylglycine-generating enzyme required for sulfatase activity